MLSMSTEFAWARPHLSFHPLFYPLLIAALNAALFAPMMGHGFVHDDFAPLFSVAYYPFWRGAMSVNAGPSYAPFACLSYKLDWMLWGWNPFAFAAGNLLVHTANILLIYALAQKLWRSDSAGRWAAVGYAVLFPANVSAVMFTG